MDGRIRIYNIRTIDPITCDGFYREKRFVGKKLNRSILLKGSLQSYKVNQLFLAKLPPKDSNSHPGRKIQKKTNGIQWNFYFIMSIFLKFYWVFLSPLPKIQSNTVLQVIWKKIFHHSSVAWFKNLRNARKTSEKLQMFRTIMAAHHQHSVLVPRKVTSNQRCRFSLG